MSQINIDALDNKNKLFKYILLIMLSNTVLFVAVFYFVHPLLFTVAVISVLIYSTSLILYLKGNYTMSKIIYITNFALTVFTCFVLLYNSLQDVFWGAITYGVLMVMMPYVVCEIKEKIARNATLVFSILLAVPMPFISGFVSIDIPNNFANTLAFQLITYFTGMPLILIFIAILTNQVADIARQIKIIFGELEFKSKELEESKASTEKMIEELQKSKAEEERRNWVNVGVANFMSMLRNENDATKIYDKVIYEMVGYASANLASLYVFDKQKNALVSKSVYAYDRKKFINHELAIGEGLIGQCFVEKENIILTEIPSSYIKIKSGLGEAHPKFVGMFPVISNEVIYGVLEIAFFENVDNYTIQYIEKCTENIGSMINNVSMDIEVKELLAQSKTQTEQLQSQEEELRQNLEEMTATQEEMLRKEKELIERVKELEGQLNAKV